jgi:hypothetical protein
VITSSTANGMTAYSTALSSEVFAPMTPRVMSWSVTPGSQ